jgi:hypothetical protein
VRWHEPDDARVSSPDVGVKFPGPTRPKEPPQRWVGWSAFRGAADITLRAGQPRQPQRGQSGLRASPDLGYDDYQMRTELNVHSASQRPPFISPDWPLLIRYAATYPRTDTHDAV